MSAHTFSDKLFLSMCNVSKDLKHIILCTFACLFTHVLVVEINILEGMNNNILQLRVKNKDCQKSKNQEWGQD